MGSTVSLERSKGRSISSSRNVGRMHSAFGHVGGEREDGAKTNVVPDVCGPVDGSDTQILQTDGSLDKTQTHTDKGDTAEGSPTLQFVSDEEGLDSWKDSLSDPVLGLSGSGHSSRQSGISSMRVNNVHGLTVPGTIAQDDLLLRIKEAEKTFVTTESFRHVTRKLDQFGHVTICGASGEGKTSMALMLARDCMEKGYEGVFVENIDAFDFSECISSTHRLVLIMDEIFGTVRLSSDVLHLRNLLTSIKSHIEDTEENRTDASCQTNGGTDQDEWDEENKDIRVVFTSEKDILQGGISTLDCQLLTLFKDQTVVNLTESKDYCYSGEEKVSMFMIYKTVHRALETDDISKQDLLDLDSALIAFPLTCKLFFEFAVFQDNGKDFFKRPLFYLTSELNNILSLRNNQTAALILMLLCEDKLDLAKLKFEDSNQKMDELFKHVTDFVPSATRSGIATAARSFRGTFFSGGDTLRFAHSSIYDACAFVLFKISPSFVLKYCSYDFLYEQLKPGPVEETRSTDHLHFLFVSDNYYDLVATRLVTAIKQGHFTKTVTHPILKNGQFVKLLIQKLKGEACSIGLSDAHWIHHKDRGRGFLYWAVQGHSNLLVNEIEKVMNIRFTQSEITEALEGCAETSTLSQIKQLLPRCGSELLPQTKDSLLLLSTEHGRWEIAEYLLTLGANIKTLNKTRHNYCHLLCKSDRPDMLKALSNQGNEITQKQILAAINSVDIDGRTPVMLAAMYGSAGCFQMLSDKSDMDLQDAHGSSVVHLASFGGSIDIVQHVLTPSNINTRGRHGWTPVMGAAVAGKKSVFDFLVSNNADLTLVDDFGDSLLHLACRGGNTDIVRHVLTPSTVNTRGRHGWTPVMAAAVAGKKSVFDFLVANNADLTLVDDYGDSLLHLACQGGNRNISQHALKFCDINIRGKNGRTPIMKAAGGAQQSMFDFLVSHNADLTLVDDDGDSLVHLACQGGNIHIVKSVLTPSNIDKRRMHGWTPVMLAAAEGQQRVFTYLVSNNADLTLLSNSDDSLLHLACQGGNIDIVQHALSPSDINSRGRNGRTPIMIAAMEGHQSVFDCLLSNNADLTLVDDYGESLLHLACEGGNRDIVQHVLTPSNINSRDVYGLTPVMVAAVEGQQNLFDLLVSNKADLTLVDNNGDSLLHLACQGGSQDIVQHVLTPYNINSRDLNGMTPLMKAAFEGQQSVFDYLLSNNADPTLLDDNGDSLLHLACQGGNLDIVKHVLTPSVINSTCRHGWTPVMAAAVNGQQNVFDFLVSNNADLTLVDDNGDSLLHWACQGGNVDIVQRVLTPSNVNSRGREMKTPVMEAAYFGRRNIIELLVENHADVSLVDIDGDNAVNYAMQEGHTDIAEYLKSLIQ